MDISPQLEEGAPFISRYGNGGFVVGNQPHKGSLCISAEGITPISAQAIDDLEPAHLEALDDELELLLIGTGSSIQFPPTPIRDYLANKQIPYDMMDTGAACRTFNIVLQEDRKAAAILLAI